MFGTPAWQANRDLKLAQREERLDVGREIVKKHGETVSPHLRSEIIKTSAPGIVEGIKERKWTATQVLVTYIGAALACQEQTNAITEPLFIEAWEIARGLDEEFEKTGRVVGILHGVPISLKDQFNVVGVDSTIGFTHKINQPAEDDALLVKLCKRAGGVPFLKSAVPQTLLSFECSNPLFGTSVNPHMKGRTPGGSSGGEAALIGADASPLGFGSDIGGSLRIPAHYSGCFGLKPCFGRFPNDGAAHSNPGFEAIKGSLGPMGRCIDDLELGTRVIVDASEELSRVQGLFPMKYRKVELPKKLKFGYYTTDGFVRASPACKRAVLETVAALRKAGHECVEFTPLTPVRALEIFVALTSAGGYETLLSGLKGDPQEPAMWLVTLGPTLYAPVRKLASFAVSRFVGDKVMGTLLQASRYKSVTEMQAWTYARDNFVKEFRQHVWGELGFDSIICPTQAVPSLSHGATWDLSPLSLGTILWNIVDSTVGALPVTFVDEEKDKLPEDFLKTGGTGTESHMVEGRVFGPGGVYDSKKMAGLPVGVQVVGGAWEEERVIETMRIVDTALGPRGFGPGEFARRKVDTL